MKNECNIGLYYLYISGFQSLTFDFFVTSLQNKETQKVHRHFCLENRKIGLIAQSGKDVHLFAFDVLFCCVN